MSPRTALVLSALAGGLVLAGLSAAEPQPKRVPLYEGLGTHGRKVSGATAEAQRYFDQGLAFLYAYNHDEAARSFRQAAELSPECALAWWGIAAARGPHINKPEVGEAHAREGGEALERARKAAAKAPPLEGALIEAQTARYGSTRAEDRKKLDEAYAAAMRKVHRDHPDDADVGALFAESLLTVRPWDQWTPAGKAQPGTEEVVRVLEEVLRRAPEHPLALHLYIHAVEASPEPGKADAAADRLRDLQPGLGHLVHMPSHIDVRRGRWQKALEANRKAIEADRKYRQIAPPQDFYNLYMAHNHHMLAYAAMMRGQRQVAVDAIDTMARGIPPAWVKDNAGIADAFVATPVEVRLRFGMWDEVLAAPEPPEFLPIARALRHAARGVSHAARGQIEEARKEQAAFRAARAKVPEDAIAGHSKAADVIAVAGHLLDGELLYREGKVEEGLAALREAVAREDGLAYDEPPDWMHPVRHALGATLLREGRAAEAEKVYRDDLQRLPENGWSLYGLARALREQGKKGEAADAERRFREVWRDADVSITSSCFCQPGK